MKQDFNTVHNQDCIAGLKQLPDGVVDLAFADPPFNIGYDYDVYDDKLEAERVPGLVAASGSAEVVRVLKPDGTFWLAIGDEYAAELKVMLQREHRADLPQLGHLVLHVRRELQDQVQPLARPPVPLRQGPEALHVQRRRDPRPLGPAAGLRRHAGPIPRAGCPTTPGSSARRTCPTASQPTRTPGTSRASAARSRSGPAGTAARCPSSCWAGSSARAATRASWCSTRSAAAARRWPWPRSSGRRFLGFELSAEYAEQIKQRLAAHRAGRSAGRRRRAAWPVRRTRPTAASC